MNIIKTEHGSISFLKRAPRKLPKVDPPVAKQPRTGWLRWPFHHLEPLREEIMKKTFVQRLNPVLNGNNDSRKRHKHDKMPPDKLTESRHTEQTNKMEISMVSDGSIPVSKSGWDKNHEQKEVKRRPKSTSQQKCNDNNSTKPNKRMSYPPCDTKGLHEYFQKLNTKDAVPTKNTTHKGTVPSSTLSNAFSISCPALHNPKYVDKVQSHKMSRRHESAQMTRQGKCSNDHFKVKNHHKHDRGNADCFTDSHGRSYRKVKKSKNHSNRDCSIRSQRPKPPSWQDPTPPPTVTITDPPQQDLKHPAASVTGDKDQHAPSSNAESVYAASSVLESEPRSMNRRSAGLMSRAHLKRTRSRVINSKEIPEEDHVIPLSRTQHNEFHLKETHQDNHIYLTENALRCRKWLSELEVEDLRDDDGAHGLTAFPERYRETVTLDLEVSHDRWNYLGSPYPSDSDSDND